MNRYDAIPFKMDIPRDVRLIIDVIEKAGFEAYAVGGCVRDAILGRQPDDWDITTSAMPEDIKSLFRRTIDTGIKHGTVTVMIKKKGYEITTYRVDGAYADGRHPDSVTFTASLAEDLSRRDFTVNAMAYNPGEGLVDRFGGMNDIENKIIRAVGDPMERFGEDALRILRGVRFCAQLGFKLDGQTAEATRALAPTLERISRERIRNELEKLILSDRPDMLRDAYRLGITAVILPEFDRMMETEQNTKYHIYNVGEHTLAVMLGVEPDRILRWAALLHDVGKPDRKTTNENGVDSFKGHAIAGEVKARTILRGLRLDNKTIDVVTRLIGAHMDRPVKNEFSPELVRRSVNKIGKDIYPMYLKLMRADINAKNPEYAGREREELAYMEQIFDEILSKGECTSTDELAISGKDLVALGIEPGRRIGIILEDLLNMVLQDPQLNDRDILIDIVKKIILR